MKMNSGEGGVLGREKSLPIMELKELEWIEMEGLHATIITKDNRKIRLYCLENVLGTTGRKAFLDYMKAHHQNINIFYNKES